MKIILANKFYYIKGGAERYYFDLKKLLESHSHEVIPFAMHDEKNFSSQHSKYFVSNIDFNKPGHLIKKACRALYSCQAKKKFNQLLKDTKPDIIHIHNIYHQISPSILTIAKKHKIPVVQTLHDFKLICPNYTLYSQNKLCEQCKKYKYYKCAFNKCIKNKFWPSLFAAKEMYFHKIIKIYKNNINLFLAPSQFARNKILEWGIIPKKQITVLPEFVFSHKVAPSHEIGSLSQAQKVGGQKIGSLSQAQKVGGQKVGGLSQAQKVGGLSQAQKVGGLSQTDPQHGKHNNNYILYFGRLIKSKGIDTLILAMKNVLGVETGHGLFLHIAGRGPQEKELRRLVKKENINNVKFLGFLDQNKLKQKIHNSLFTIHPSLVYETFGLSILESYNLNKPVIASNLGALPEIVENKKTGLLFEPGNSSDLANKINYLLQNKELIKQMGENAKRVVEQKFNPENHYQKLLQIYKKITKLQ